VSPCALFAFLKRIHVVLLRFGLPFKVIFQVYLAGNYYRSTICTFNNWRPNAKKSQYDDCGGPVKLKLRNKS